MARKKQKADEEQPPAASTSASSFRSWPDLPQDVLLSIRDRFSLSIPDLVAFSAVCRSWRSAASAAAPFTGPPLLLVPSANTFRSGSLQWSGTPQCLLKSLTVTTRSYRSAISPETLKKKCVGYSYGQLIFVGRKRVVLADVFTGREVHPPDPAGDCRFAFGILKAPLPSAACLLLLVSFDPACNKFSNILCWKPGTDDWSKLELKNCVAHGIATIGVFKDRILVMDFLCPLIEVEFFPRPSRNYVQVPKPGRGHYMPDIKFDPFLVECGDELLFVCIIHNLAVQVYRFDWSGSAWVKMDGLGDWCLFIAVGMKFVMACHDPRRWGGRAAELGLWFLWMAGRWTCGHFLRSFRRGIGVFRWPLPVWVYPSMLL